MKSSHCVLLCWFHRWWAAIVLLDCWRWMCPRGSWWRARTASPRFHRSPLRRLESRTHPRCPWTDRRSWTCWSRGAAASREWGVRPMRIKSASPRSPDKCYRWPGRSWPCNPRRWRWCSRSRYSSQRKFGHIQEWLNEGDSGSVQQTTNVST